MITILYPIYELYKNEDRIKAFNISINNLDSRFNIIISDTGKEPSLECIKTEKTFTYVYRPENFEVFNKSITINNGFKKIKDDLFIILDAEIIVHPDLYNKILDLNIVQTKPFMGFTRHYHIDKNIDIENYKYRDIVKYIEANKFPENIIDNEYGYLTKIKYKFFTDHFYKPGRFILTNKFTFETIKGFDISYIGYGAHDYKYMFDFCHTFPDEPITCLNIYDVHLYHKNDRKINEKKFFKKNEKNVWAFFHEKLNINYTTFMKEKFKEVLI